MIVPIELIRETAVDPVVQRHHLGKEGAAISIAFDRKHDPATVNGKKCGDDQNAMMNYADNFVDGNTTIQICEYFPDTGNTVIDLIEKTICHEMKMKNRKGAKE